MIALILFGAASIFGLLAFLLLKGRGGSEVREKVVKDVIKKSLDTEASSKPGRE